MKGHNGKVQFVFWELRFTKVCLGLISPWIIPKSAEPTSLSRLGRHTCLRSIFGKSYVPPISINILQLRVLNERYTRLFGLVSLGFHVPVSKTLRRRKQCKQVSSSWNSILSQEACIVLFSVKLCHVSLVFNVHRILKKLSSKLLIKQTEVANPVAGRRKKNIACAYHIATTTTWWQDPSVYTYQLAIGTPSLYIFATFQYYIHAS